MIGWEGVPFIELACSLIPQDMYRNWAPEMLGLNAANIWSAVCVLQAAESLASGIIVAKTEYARQGDESDGGDLTPERIFEGRAEV